MYFREENAVLLALLGVRRSSRTYRYDVGREIETNRVLDKSRKCIIFLNNVSRSATSASLINNNSNFVLELQSERS